MADHLAEEETEHTDKKTAAQQPPPADFVEVDAETGNAATPDDSEALPSSSDHDDGDTKTEKRKHMTVAADAPWKDRMWEGTHVCIRTM